MTLPRLVQNFSGNRALLIGVPEAGRAALASVLARLGMATDCVPATETGLDSVAASIQPDRDVLIVDGDADVPNAGPLACYGRLPLAPVVALVGVEAPGRLKALMSLGATAFIRKPIQPSGVYSAIFLGINEHRMKRHLAEIIQDHESRRRGRRSLVKAILRLVGQGMDDDGAYELLRREAMRARMSVEAFSEAFLEDGSGQARAEAPPGTVQSKMKL